VTEGTSGAATNPPPTSDEEAVHVSATHPVSEHPITLVTSDDLSRSRLTVFFRLLLAIPHLIVLYLYTIAFEVVLVISWVVGIVLGRVPNGLHNFNASYWRYRTRVTAYVLLLANPYPPFGASGTYPVDLEIAPAAEQNRLTILFRLLLALPALVLAYVFFAGLAVIAVFGWFAGVILGRMPEGLEKLGVFLLSWESQSWGYLFLLTGRYPSLGGLG
jgi:hypothetical protein